MPILVFLGLSVLELGPMYATDRRQSSDLKQKHRLMPPPIRGGGIIISQHIPPPNWNPGYAAVAYASVSTAIRLRFDCRIAVEIEPKSNRSCNHPLNVKHMNCKRNWLCRPNAPSVGFGVGGALEILLVLCCIVLYCILLYCVVLLDRNCSIAVSDGLIRSWNFSLKMKNQQVYRFSST